MNSRSVKFLSFSSIFSAFRAATADMSRTLFSWTFWLIIAGVSLVCFLSGPFGTIDTLPWGIRLVYWTLQVSVAGIAGIWTISLARTQSWDSFVPLVPISLGFGLFVCAVVILFSLALLEPIEKYPGAPTLMVYSIPSASLIFFLLALIVPGETPSEPRENASVRPYLFDRLKKHKAAQRILSLSAQDHYVEVVTDLGPELCLIRLADAIAEAAPEHGFQIHRSHWVALHAVVSLEASGQSAQVHLNDGRALAISQSRLADFRKFLDSVQNPTV